MKPEAQSEVILWDWLKTKGESVIEVYFNRVNEVNAPIFKTQGINQKPDFIVEIDKGFGKEFIVFEIKNGSKSRNILGANKIINKYIYNYVTKKTIYLINDEPIRINHFLIATENSLLGHLFKKETWIDNLADTESKSKHYVTKLGLIPKKEGNRTFEFVRFLWNLYGKIRNDFDEKPSLGILICNGDTPAMMITKYDDKKKRWGQRFWKI